MNKDTTPLGILALKMSQWTLLGYGTNQTIRFFSHLIVARFLLPEQFGLSQIINVFIQGMLMFCDLGMGVNIIQHKRGEDPVFLQTVWTLEICRGLLIWLMTFLIAPPIASFYDAPEIRWLLPFVGSSLFLISFTSTNYWIQYRNLYIARITFIEIFGSVAGCLVMIICAWYWRAIWALLIGQIVFSILRSLLSNLLLVGPKMRFRWDRDAVREVIHFGKWVYLSTVNTFLTSRIDIVVMALFLDKSSLGLYGIAASIVSLFVQGLIKLGNSMLIPFYSRIKSDDLKEMRARVFYIRLIITSLALPVFYLFIIWGQNIIDFVYPEAFRRVGGFLQILAVGGAIQVVSVTITPILIANGDSFRHMLTRLSHSILLLISMTFGGYYYGSIGLIIAIILSHLFNYPIVVLNIRKYGVWLPLLDFVAFAVSAFIAFVFFQRNLLFTVWTR